MEHLKNAIITSSLLIGAVINLVQLRILMDVKTTTWEIVAFKGFAFLYVVLVLFSIFAIIATDVFKEEEVKHEEIL